MLCNIIGLCLYTVHVTAFCLGGRFFPDTVYYYLFVVMLLLWCCWLGVTKGAQPVKTHFTNFKKFTGIPFGTTWNFSILPGSCTSSPSSVLTWLCICMSCNLFDSAVLLNFVTFRICRLVVVFVHPQHPPWSKLSEAWHVFPTYSSDFG